MLPPVDAVAAPLLALAFALVLAFVVDRAREHGPRLWRERCRYRLARHHPETVITSATLLSVAAAGGGNFAHLTLFHRCSVCGHRLNDVHPEIRPLEGLST